MKLKLNTHCIAALLTTLLAVPTFAATIESNINKTFTVSPGDNLVIDSSIGSIKIITKDVTTLSAEVARTATSSSEAKAEELMANHEVTIKQNGNKVLIVGKKKKRISWSDNSGKLNVNYVITIPTKFNLQLKTSDGDIHAEDLTGTIQAGASDGNLKFGNIRGPIMLSTSDGDVLVGNCEGPVTVKTSDGDIQLGNIVGPITLKTSDGDVSVGDCTGDVTVKTSDGDLSISNITGKATVQTSDGDINIKSVSGVLKAQASDGSIQASITSQPTGNCSLQTSDGSIHLTIASDISAKISGRASDGKVSSNLKLTDFFTDKGKSLTGTLNKGGVTISTQTSDGDIELNSL